MDFEIYYEGVSMVELFTEEYFWTYVLLYKLTDRKIRYIGKL